MASHWRTSLHVTSFLLLVTAIVGGVWTRAEAITIGPGTTIVPNNDLDNPGGRINVDQGFPVLLQPGTYTATLFNFDAGGPGDVTPFLAVSNGSDSYLVIAVGDTRNVVGIATDQSVAFGANNMFTLLSAQSVFAGISNINQNPIFLGPPGPTDHDAIALDAVLVGGTIDGFSNPDAVRTYAFSIEVSQALPEPSAVLLGLLGLGALSFRRRHIA